MLNQTPMPLLAIASSQKRHILTVALEDYFQVGAFNQFIQNGQWYRFETRLERNTQRALDLLDRHGVKATFFVLGWIADHYPEVVRKVAERGHEIASKGYYHRSIRQMTPGEFREDLARSREAIERAARTRVLGHRVAHEWFAPSDLWALDVLAEEGFAYDSSVGPIFRRYSHEPWRRFVHQHACRGKTVWEFPLSSWRFLGWDLPICGGNYFRQFPHRILKHAIEYWHRHFESPFVMYFHVWELDPDQPKINTASLLTRLRHYRNLDKMSWVLEDYLSKYQFTSVSRYLGLDHQLSSAELARLAARKKAWSASDLRLSHADLATPLPPENRTPVSVVIPCFNEELVLPYLANTLRSVEQQLSGYDLRFLFVDDCSTDGTWTALHKIFGKWPSCTILQHQKNQGVAGAILTGIRAATTEIVCSMDCDCTYDPHGLGEMIPRLADGVDLVTASPYHPQGQVKNVPGWRLALSKTSSWLYRRVLRQKLATYTSCFRVYRRSAVVDLRIQETGYLGIAETLARLDLQGSKIVEHPAVLEVRMIGRSKMKVVRTIFGHLGLLARLLAARLFAPAPAGPKNPALVPVATSQPQLERTTA